MFRSTENQPLTEKRSSSGSSRGHAAVDCCLGHIKTTSRLSGLAVLAVLWAATVTTLRGDIESPTYVGYYLLAASLTVTFFEITWILDKMACCVREGCCCRCWSVILWVDGWRKFVLYTALSVPLFLQGLKGAFHVVCGFCLLVLACLYLLKSFASLVTKQHEQTAAQAQAQPSERSTSRETDHVSVTLRHEMATQTDVPSASAEKKTKRHTPPNPFDDTGDDEDTEKDLEEVEIEKDADATGDDRKSVK